jgi:N-acetylglucosaminyldiphosphoundecaprenol N-acetyl-beta-D-mannosaminyltransferase
MGANAYREAADNYNEEKNYRELLAVYEGALEMKPDSPETDRRQSRYVIGMRVDYTTYSKAAAKIVNLARSAKGAYVCVATAHMAVMTHRDLAFREVVNGADLVTPDGMPLVWELKARGVKNAERVRGLNLTMEVCKRAEESGLPVGLYGGLDGDVLRLVCEKLKKAFPRLVIVYAKAPPFSEAVTVDEETVREMIRSGARIIFVGLGCPKQETWMALHKERLPAVTLGVGAAFDFIAGVKREAPLWMQRMGLEWLFRLMQEPRRLWKRYVIGNAQFLFYHLKG